jgi:hypothetical protein
MTFRGVYRDGVVIIDDPSGLRNGAVVEVIQPARVASGASTKVRRKKATTKKGKDPLLALAGIWKDRPEWKGKSTLEVARALRKKAMGRDRG